MKKTITTLIILSIAVYIGIYIGITTTIKNIEINGINGNTGLVKIKCLGQEFEYYYE